MHHYLSRRSALIVVNAMMILGLWVSGSVSATPEGIAAAAVTIGVMNAIAWRSSKEFPEWR